MRLLGALTDIRYIALEIRPRGWDVVPGTVSNPTSRVMWVIVCCLCCLTQGSPVCDGTMGQGKGLFPMCVGPLHPCCPPPPVMGVRWDSVKAASTHCAWS